MWVCVTCGFWFSKSSTLKMWFVLRASLCRAHKINYVKEFFVIPKHCVILNPYEKRLFSIASKAGNWTLMSAFVFIHSVNRICISLNQCDPNLRLNLVCSSEKKIRLNSVLGMVLNQFAFTNRTEPYQIKFFSMHESGWNGTIRFCDSAIKYFCHFESLAPTPWLDFIFHWKAL